VHNQHPSKNFLDQFVELTLSDNLKVRGVLVENDKNNLLIRIGSSLSLIPLREIALIKMGRLKG